MIYFENASRGEEGLNTHVMSWTMSISLSNFLDRDFFFAFEIPSSTPPDYAFRPEFGEKFKLLLESPRSLVSELVKIPNRRVFEIERNVDDKAAFNLIYSYFATTEAMKERFESTIVWDSFSVGRIPQIREELATSDLVEWTHTKLANPAAFYFLGRDEKRALLDSIKIRYFDGVENLASKIAEEIGQHYAVHLRQGDYFANYAVDGYAIHSDRFRAYVRAVFMDDSRPVVIATDGLHEKEMFAEIFEGYRLVFIDEFVFNNYRQEYGELEFTDFNALSILNQLLCASADAFIGTYRSTFTGIIHRLRQERYAKTDFDFFPDERVARQLLNGQGRIVPDRSGFFDWNRYSVFSGDHSSMAWMREWNHELTTLEI